MVLGLPEVAVVTIGSPILDRSEPGHRGEHGSRHAADDVEIGAGVDLYGRGGRTRRQECSERADQRQPTTFQHQQLVAHSILLSSESALGSDEKVADSISKSTTAGTTAPGHLVLARAARQMCAN
jgi:hypothetical protein